MADRRPLIVNSNAQQIQELAVSDGLIGNGTFPLGGIIMWSGAISAIPTGWSLCDGSNGTPDLRNKFVLGATNDGSDGTYPGISVSQTGGTADAVVVQHNHSITEPNGGQGHKHSITFSNSDSGAEFIEESGTGNSGTEDTNFATTGITIDNEGVSGTNQNLPPFLALAYIQRTS